MASSIAVFLLDVSPGMAELVYDEGTGKRTSKLDLCKEYITRKIAPKIQSGRKTEHAGLITFGGPTNNPFFATDEVATAEAVDPADYIGVASVFPPQTAKAGILSRLKNVRVGHEAGNPIAALIVVDELLRVHAVGKRSRTWRKEIFLLMDAKSKLKQGGWENALDRIMDRQLIMRVIGVGFDERGTDEMTEVELKARPKIERFWRTFNTRLLEQVTEDGTMDTESHAPALGDIFEALSSARGPHVDQPNSTLQKIDLRIGDTEINQQEGIEIPIKYSKATSVARPPSLKKVIAKELPKSRNLPSSVMGGESQGSGSYGGHGRGFPPARQMQHGNEADLTAYTKHVILRKIEAEEQATAMDIDKAFHPAATDRPFHAEEMEEEQMEVQELAEGSDDKKAREKFEEVEVNKDNLVKAYKFGDQWIPIKEEDFTAMETVAGMDVLGFVKSDHYQRYQSMGEVYFLWSDPDSTKSQIVFSSLVQGMRAENRTMLVRWVQKADAAPRVGMAAAQVTPDGLEYMCWVQLPFKEDERGFIFPSLSKLVSKTGQVITEHKLLPTDQQLLLMNELVGEMDLDTLAEDNDGTIEPWFDPARSFNPAIHRIKEATFHQAITQDLNADPVPPPHPALRKYLQTPEEIINSSLRTLNKLKTDLDIKVVPPKLKRGEGKAGKETVAANQIEIDDLFQPSTSSVQNGASFSQTPKIKPDGSLIGQDFPLQDFENAIASGGDIVEAAIRDMGDYIQTQIEGSFSKSRSRQDNAIKCMREMKKQALRLEETDTYITFLEEVVHKNTAFVEAIRKVEPALLDLTAEEAAAALE